MTAPDTMKRHVGLGGAVLLGLGSILGTGVFVSLGLAAGIAGNWSVGALAVAAGLATCNALSSAQLAANHPVSGGTYAYGYRYLRPELGFVAGLAFLLAKSASAAAAAIGVMGYGAQFFGFSGIHIGSAAAGFVILMTLLVAAGLRRANIVNAALVGMTLIALVALIGAVWLPETAPDLPGFDDGLRLPDFLEASALLFVAFTGYGRIATLGAEVRTPRRTIPRAILITLAVTCLVYLGVLVSGNAVLGAAGFADATLTSGEPLKAVADALGHTSLSGLVAIAAVTAMAGVLLNLVLGLSRVAYAMGTEGDLPGVFGRLRGGEPLIATLAIGAVIAAMALFGGGLQTVWSFSAFTVLVYYAITNLCALQLAPDERLYPRFISVIGLVGCLGLAFWIDPGIMMAGSAALVGGLVLRTILRRALA